MEHGRAMLTRFAVVCAAVTALAGVASAAEDEIDSRRSGPYLGVNAGVAFPNFESQYFFTPPPFQARVEERPSLEVMGRVGWRVLPYLAFEGQYEWVREWELNTKRATCGKVDAQILTGNVRLFAPFDAVHPYLLGGAGAGLYESRVSEKEFDISGNRCTKTQNVDFSEEEWELAVRLGGGLDVYITRRIIFNFEVSTIYSADEQLGEAFPFVSVSGGLGYRF